MVPAERAVVVETLPRHCDLQRIFIGRTWEGIASARGWTSKKGGLTVRWLIDACLEGVDWDGWLFLCTALVVLWAAAIAATTALFQASGQRRRKAQTPVSERRTDT